MVNYKPRHPIALNFNGIYYPLKEGEKAIQLNNRSITTVGYTLHKADSATNYQVPTGKKFIMVAGLLTKGSSLRKIDLVQSDTVDSSTNPVIKNSTDIPIVATAYTEHIWMPFPDLPEIEAEKYLNNVTNNITGSAFYLHVYGVENEA